MAAFAERPLAYLRRAHPRISQSEEQTMTDMKSLMIGALLVAVVVLGYLYWDRQRNTVEIKLPSMTIEKR
jgi:hypothetical protein